MAVGFAALVWFYLESLLNIRQRQEIEDRVARAEKALVDNPDKTRPLWDVARSHLELYFERNLSQIPSIFWLTVLISLVGFTLISYGVVTALDANAKTAAFLSTGAGLVTEFVAATFLVIFKSTMTQASDYVGTLERINAVGMSLQVLDSIPDTSREKDKTKSALVLAILAAFVGGRSKSATRGSGGVGARANTRREPTARS